MKVAMICFDLVEYGVAVSNSLAADDQVEVMLVVSADAAGPHLHKLDARVATYSMSLPRLREPHRQVVAMRRLLRQIKRFNPDVIHVQHAHLWFSLVQPLLRRYPMVITVHDPVHHVGDAESAKTPQRLVHWTYRRADRLITHADELKHVLVHDVGVPAAKITVIPHIAQVAPPSVRQHEEIEGQLLFFGRIWAYKGLDYLIRAEPRITERFPQARIVIAGRGEDFEKYRALMVHPDRFIVDNDYIPDERVAQYFSEASIVVLPYVDASQSGVVPVAYAFERPVVATRVGGLPSVVDDGVTGYLVPPRDSEGLADALIKLLEDADLRRKMGRAGNEKLRREWAPEVVGPSHTEVYKRALSGT